MKTLEVAGDGSLPLKQENATGVLMLNMGGPTSLEEIRPFLFRIFSDREIIRLPVQGLMARLLASRRSGKVTERYEYLGGGSPLLKLTEAQAQGLQNVLSETGRIKVFVGMRYWHPFIEEAVSRIVEGNVGHLIVLPLFPQYSKTTTGSCLKELRSALRGSPHVRLSIVESFHDYPAYIEALREKVAEGLARFDHDKSRVQVLFSAHSIPKSFADAGDPYPEQVRQTMRLLLERLPPVAGHLGFQSRSGPVRWLEPATDMLIRRLGDEGHKKILMVPISFVSDHVETLYEMDVMYKELAAELGFARFERSPSLNDSPKFIEALASIVREYLE